MSRIFGSLMLGGLLFFASSGCGAPDEAESVTKDTAAEVSHDVELKDACDCKARCSNNPPHWTKWYSRGRASSWGACNSAADRFCKSWTPPYHAYDASCD